MRVALLLIPVTASLAAAEPRPTEPGLTDETTSAVDAGARGLTGQGVPALASARVEGNGAVTTYLGDANGALVGAAAAEIVVLRRVAILGGAGHEAGGLWRPFAGARLSLLQQGEYPVDLAVTGVYKAEGFTEPEGELELSVAAGRRIGPTYLLANATYGQDVDAHDRDAEVGGALLARLGAVIASTSTRARFALGSQQELHGNWDLVADAGVALPFDRYAVRAAVGVSALGAQQVHVGPLGTLSLSAFF